MEELLRQLNDNIMRLSDAIENADEKRPLTRSEAARYLQIHPDTLYRWAVEEGRIRYSRFSEGKRAALRFRRKDLDEFVSGTVVRTVEEARFDLN